MGAYVSFPWLFYNRKGWVTMSKKICMVVAYHPFLDARIFKKEAKSLKKKGYNVTMIVPRRNGNLFDIDGTPFKKRFKNKVFTHEGIKIVTYNSESCKQLNKVLSDEDVWESQGFNNPLTKLAMEEDADIYHTHEYLSLFAGVGIKRLMKKRKGKDIKLVYDSHELTPDPLDSRYSEEHRENLKQKLLIMLDEVDYIITVSNSIKSWYLSHKPDMPVEVIYNSPPIAKDYTPKEHNLNKLTVGYEGNLDDKEGSKEKIICITEICSNEINFKFEIIGGTQSRNSFQIPSHLESNITLKGWIDYDDIPREMKSLDIGWVYMENVDQSLNREYALPNKFFSYLNNGVPIVMNKCKEMEDFIRTHQCGIVIDKRDPTAQEYSEAILSLYADKEEWKKMSENGRKAAVDLYSWERMEERLFNVYKQLLHE